MTYIDVQGEALMFCTRILFKAGSNGVNPDSDWRTGYHVVLDLDVRLCGLCLRLGLDVGLRQGVN